MKKISLMIAAMGVVAAANAQITLYNGLGGSIDNALWNTDGGATDTGGTNYGGAAGQVITDAGANSITAIEGGFVGLHGSSSATGILVQVFNFSGGAVGTLVGSQTITAAGLTETDSAISTGGLAGLGYTEWDIKGTTNIGGLVSGNQYLVVAQLQTGFIGYVGITYTGVPDVYVNDESSSGYNHIYSPASGTWTESGAYYSGNPPSSDSVMKITGAAASPEPASMAVLGFGALALLRRRRR